MENTIPTAEIADSAQEPLPVLVVDDDDLFLKYCNRVLDDRSFAVHMAEDGHEAFEKVQQRDYEVILLDVAMPTYGRHNLPQAAVRKGLWRGNNHGDGGAMCRRLSKR